MAYRLECVKGDGCGCLVFDRGPRVPSRPLRPCATQSCGELVTTGHCPTCQAEREASRRTSETWRHAKGASGNTIDVYQTSKWKALRLRVLREAGYLCQCDECRSCPKCKAAPRWEADRFNLTCWRCMALLVMAPANTADHITTVHEAPERAFDRSNLRAMSQAHHSRKTASETVNA